MAVQSAKSEALGPPSPTRVALPTDEPALFDLLLDLHKHNDEGWGFPAAPMQVKTWIESGTRPDPATRSLPLDQRRGIIGVIDGEDGKLLASVGLFILPVAWWSEVVALTEVWMFVRPRPDEPNRIKRYAQLFAFAKWAHDRMKADLPPDYIFPLLTGFYDDRGEAETKEVIWRMGGRKFGSVFLRR